MFVDTGINLDLLVGASQKPRLPKRSRILALIRTHVAQRTDRANAPRPVAGSPFQLVNDKGRYHSLPPRFPTESEDVRRFPEGGFWSGIATVRITRYTERTSVLESATRVHLYPIVQNTRGPI